MKIKFFCLIAVFISAGMGCSPIQIAKGLWGSSTAALEKARDKALVKSFQRPSDECMDEIVKISTIKTKITPQSPNEEISDQRIFRLFQQNRRKGFLVLMNVPNVTDTTEVGVFFVSVEKNVTRVEVSSLSEIAKINAAEIIFRRLAGEDVKDIRESFVVKDEGL